MYVPRKRRGIWPIGCDNKSKTENSKIVRRVKMPQNHPYWKQEG